MNQLEFSPISEKDEESLDTFSFLHKQLQSQAPRQNLLFVQGCKKICDRLNKSVHNRKSYGFQLLKQFILFSSDQETIEIHYKYMHYELEQGTSHLENSYGLKLKLTLGKAFEDIRNFSRKKKVYENPLYINKLVSVYDKILNLTKRESYRSVIKILAKFIQKQVVTSEGLVSQENKKNTTNLIENLQKQISYSQFERIAPNSNEINENNSQNPLKQTDLKCTKKQDFLKTKQLQKFQQQNSNWKQEVQSIDSYEEEPENQQLRMIVKSMSNQIHDYPYSSISDRKMLQNKSRQTKCMSISVTPARPCSEEYIFQTKKKKSSASKDYQDNCKVVQNVIIVRGSKTHRRQPDRFIRVPVVSDDIKIVQMIPESKKRQKQSNGHKYDNKSYKIIEKQFERTSSNSSHRKQPKTEGKYRKNQMLLNLQKFTSKFCMNESQYSDQHQCFGCKYCEIVKDMQNYRMQRTSRLNSGGMKYL